LARHPGESKRLIDRAGPTDAEEGPEDRDSRGGPKTDETGERSIGKAAIRRGTEMREALRLCIRLCGHV